MGHLLSSINSEAAERYGERPLPRVGETVEYYPRQGERRRGRVKAAALVTHVDPDNRRCDLAIFFEGCDVMDQQGVPERVGEDRGWLRLPTAQDNSAEAIAELRKDIADLRAFIMGEFPQPPMSVLDMLKNVDDRVEVLETRPAAAAPKRKPGRPKSTKKPAAAPAKPKPPAPAAKPPEPERLEPAAEEPPEPKAAA